MNRSLFTTALFTGQTWVRGGVPCAELLDCNEGRWVHGVARAFMGVGSAIRSGAPKLEPALLQRHRMIDAMLEDWQGSHVLELASGLSPRGARFSADDELDYTEVDTADAVAIKRALLARTALGQSVALRSNLHFCSGDLRFMDFESLVPSTVPLFLIAEGLFMYLNADEQRSLWGRLSALLAGRPGSQLVFDLVPTCEQHSGGQAGHVLGRLMKRSTGGRGFVQDPRGRGAILQELGDCGLGQAHCIEPADAPARWQVPHLQEHTEQLLFVATL